LTLSKKPKDLTSNNNNSMFGGSNITEFIQLLNELSIIMKNKGEVFRSLAYVKAVNELKKYIEKRIEIEKKQIFIANYSCNFSISTKHKQPSI
jgi:hypothetical protein